MTTHYPVFAEFAEIMRVVDGGHSNVSPEVIGELRPHTQYPNGLILKRQPISKSIRKTHIVSRDIQIKQGSATSLVLYSGSHYFKGTTRRYERCKVGSQRIGKSVDSIEHMLGSRHEVLTSFIYCCVVIARKQKGNVALRVPSCPRHRSRYSCCARWNGAHFSDHQPADDASSFSSQTSRVYVLLLGNPRCLFSDSSSAPRGEPGQHTNAYRGQTHEQRKHGSPSRPIHVTYRAQAPARRHTLPPTHVIPQSSEAILP